MARTTTTQGNQGTQRTGRSRRGFAAMDPEKQREIARKGGQASGGRPENLQGVDRSEAGRRGGEASEGGLGRRDEGEGRENRDETREARNE